MNLSKSELMPLNVAAKSFPLHNLSFKIAQRSFIYLGVHVTDRFGKLFKANFASFLTHTKEDLERWSVLHLSLAAKINSIKMNIVPKLFYLFECLPIFHPNSFFKKLDGLIMPFVWDGKAPRIGKQLGISGL